MNTREKLIVLIMESVGGCARNWAEVIADHLLTNGVVVIDTDAVSMKNRPLISTVASLPIDEVIGLVKAKIEGRLIVPPVKVGDTVYIPLLTTVIEKKVFSIVVQKPFYTVYCGGTSLCFSEEDFGKTVFLTREEAEKALAGRSRQ